MIKLVASQCLILTSPKLVVPVGFVSRIPSRITHGRVCPAVLSGRVLSSALLWSLVLGRCEFEKLAWWGPPLGAKARISFSELTFSQNPLSIHVHGHVSCGRGLVVVVADRWIEARSKVDY